LISCAITGKALNKWHIGIPNKDPLNSPKILWLVMVGYCAKFSSYGYSGWSVDIPEIEKIGGTGAHPLGYEVPLTP